MSMAADGTVKILIQADGNEAISSVDDLVTRLDQLGGAGQKTGSIFKRCLVLTLSVLRRLPASAL